MTWGALARRLWFLLRAEWTYRTERLTVYRRARRIRRIHTEERPKLWVSLTAEAFNRTFEEVTNASLLRDPHARRSARYGFQLVQNPEQPDGTTITVHDCRVIQ